ncbi:hypothetical protein [Streptomyces sp. CoH17]|uniref:hypothetical protein n=1 Tax=Streptomyces sp. CoH17 TaxID=2992806 RepID=UPI00226D4A1B|nr:hypothetical protein [Streptomyces sp. CoH17]
MIQTTLNNVSQKRTIRPLYANHQATPYGGFLDASWNKTTADILPGMVCAKLAGENFTLYTGAAGQEPWGLSALFLAPALGIDEVSLSNTNLFTVWKGNSDAVFEILAPAFDTAATWTNATNGSRQLLGATKSAHASGPGKLTPLNADGSSPANVSGPIATLINVVGASKIIVSLDRQPTWTA